MCGSRDTAKPEVGVDHVTATEQVVGADPVNVAELEVRDVTRDCRRNRSGGGSCDCRHTGCEAVSRDSSRTGRGRQIT